MGARGYRPPDNDRVNSRTDILGDVPQRRAREDLIPAIARMSQNASNVSPTYFEFFQRIKVGRRCSCFDIESDPSGICPVCYGVGIVGGYQKRGTKLETFDVTYPNVRCANVSPDYNNPTRPVYWSLHRTAVHGTLEFDLDIKQNLGLVDTLNILDYAPSGTSIDYWIKSPAEAEFSRLSEDTFRTRLGQQRLHFKVTLRRKSPSSPLPKVVGIRFAYKLLQHTEIRVNIPRVQESLTLEELGVYQSFSSQAFWTDNTLKNITTEDWLYNTADGTRWKINGVSDNKPEGILTSWDLQARLIQSFEGYYKVPLGNINPLILPNHIKSIQTDAEDAAAFLKANPTHMRSPGHRVETSKSDGPTVTAPGHADVGKPLREV